MQWDAGNAIGMGLLPDTAGGFYTDCSTSIGTDGCASVTGAHKRR